MAGDRTECLPHLNIKVYRKKGRVYTPLWRGGPNFNLPSRNRQDRRQRRTTLGTRHLPTEPRPGLGPALDALAVGIVAPRITTPVNPTRLEVEPHFLDSHPSSSSSCRARITRQHHLTGQFRQYSEQLHMIFFLAVAAVTISSRCLARRLQVRRISVNQFTGVDCKLRKAGMAAAMHQFDRIIAAKLFNGRRFAFHDGAFPKEIRCKRYAPASAR